MCIDLGDYHLGITCGRFDDIHRYTQAAQTIDIRRSNADQGHIDRHPSAGEQPRNIRQKDRRVIPHTPLQRAADIVSDKETVHLELVRQFLAGIGRRSHRQQVDDVCIVDMTRMFHQSVYQMLRLAAAGADKDIVADLTCRIASSTYRPAGHTFVSSQMPVA